MQKTTSFLKGLFKISKNYINISIKAGLRPAHARVRAFGLWAPQKSFRPILRILWRNHTSSIIYRFYNLFQKLNVWSTIIEWVLDRVSLVSLHWERIGTWRWTFECVQYLLRRVRCHQSSKGMLLLGNYIMKNTF